MRKKNRLHSIRNGMISRCYNPKHAHYSRYGGRGISVCDDWRDGSSKFCAWAMANGYDDSKTLDRIDVNGNYCPDNCRWTTMKEQHNNRSNNVVIEYAGKAQTLSQWAEELGIPYHTLLMRIIRGWTPERALAPVTKKDAV